MSGFKVGDRVRVVGGQNAGAVTTVTSELRRFGYHPEYGYLVKTDGEYPDDELVHDVDIDPGHGWDFECVAPRYLVPLYDGNEKAEWTQELRNLCRSKESA